MGLLVLAAWLLPALVPAVSAAAAWIDAGHLEPARLLALAAGLGWSLLLLLPGWRRFLLELTRPILRRVGFAALSLAALAAAAAAFGGARGPLAVGLALGLSLLGLTAAIRTRTADRRSFRGQTALLIIYIGLFIGLELFIGLVILPTRSHNSLAVVHDPVLGWKLRPGLVLERDNDRFSSREVINDDGFRGAVLPPEKPPGTKRIVCLGDSHTEAYTVNEADTWSAQLAGRLSAEGPVELLNLGVGGYSTDQELLAYLHHGRRVNPDLVLLQFCSNDLPFNLRDRYWRGGKPCFRRFGSRLLLTNVPVPDRTGSSLASGPLLRHSPTLIYIESVLRKMALERVVEHEMDMEEAWAVTRLLLRDLDAMVREDGARMVVFNADQEKPEIDRRLRMVLTELGIPYLETAPAYAGGDFRTYWVDSHWNGEGHRAIADTLAPAVDRLLNGGGLEPEGAS